MTNKKDYSTDKLYVMEISKAISCGFCSESLSKRNHGMFANQVGLQVQTELSVLM